MFTVPFDLGRDEHLRARMKPSGGIEHLLPPEYHGDPVDPQGGILCYQVFGWRMMDELRAVGFEKTGALLYWSLIHGLLGPDQCVFLPSDQPERMTDGAGTSNMLKRALLDLELWARHLLRKMFWNPRTTETIREFNDAWSKDRAKRK